MDDLILVTGGAGFIGSHVTERLLNRGNRVVVLDNFDRYYDPAIKRRNLESSLSSRNCRLIEGDIRDPRSVAEAFALGPFAAVVHLAARAGVRPSLQDPALYEQVNVGGTIQLLEAAKVSPTTHFVVGSSSSVYGATSEVPFSESSAADQPSSPYAASKRAAEMMGYAYHHLYGMPVTSSRFFTVYGPRQRPEMAIHKFTHAIMTGQSVDVYGDGSSRRDYTYVGDIVDGVVLTVDSGSGYRLYNLGTRVTTPLSELIKLIGDHLGRTPIVRRQPDQLGDVPVTYADTSRAEVELGYRARTPLREGLGRFIDWYMNTHNRQSTSPP